MNTCISWRDDFNYPTECRTSRSEQLCENNNFLKHVPRNLEQPLFERARDEDMCRFSAKSSVKTCLVLCVRFDSLGTSWQSDSMDSRSCLIRQQKSGCTRGRWQCWSRLFHTLHWKSFLSKAFTTRIWWTTTQADSLRLRSTTGELRTGDREKGRSGLPASRCNGTRFFVLSFPDHLCRKSEFFWKKHVWKCFAQTDRNGHLLFTGLR